MNKPNGISPDDTGEKQDTRFKPGQSGNPTGRPRGARNKVSEGLLEALAKHFEANGDAAIETVFKERPHDYLKIIASLVPKQMENWFGSVERTGTVGLHRPYTKDPAFRNLSAAEAATAYSELLGRVTAYLAEMEVPASIMEAMSSTGSGEINWIDAKSSNKPASFNEWTVASCGYFGEDESETHVRLSLSRAMNQPLSSEQAILLRVLEDKYEARRRCVKTLVLTNRAKLRAP